MPISISTMGQTMDNNLRLKNIQAQLYDLQTQLASGKKTQQYAGLGTHVVEQQRARMDLTHIEVYQSNINIGISRITVMERTLGEFQKQAENVTQFMANERQEGSEIALGQLRDFADQATGYLRNLLNTREGDRYIFSGADAFSPTIIDGGAHDSYMGSLISDWRSGTITTDQLLASYESTPDTTMGYSASLSAGTTRGVFVRADTNVDVDYTVYGNADPIKDIMNVMTLVSQLDLDKLISEAGDAPSTKVPPGVTNDDKKENFYKLYEGLIKKAEAAFTEIEKMREELQRTHLRLNDISEIHKADKFTLENVVSDIEDVDTTDVAVRVNSLQLQLNAAYQVTARIGQLSLSQYLF